MTSKHSTVTLSEHLGVTAEKLEKLDILNTNLGVDLKLFIDPKLVRQSTIAEFSNSEKIIKEYFEKLFAVNAQSHLSQRLVDEAVSMIAIKEPKGLSIGYGDSRDSGTSISKTVAQQSLRSLNEMLSVGFNDLKVMELLGLFVGRFGSDSISDLIAHIIYHKLCEFTQRICNEQRFVTEEFLILGKKYNLPRHPFKNKKTQIIFVPLSVLSELPVATSWDEIAAAAAKNAKVRKDFNDLVGGNVKQFALGMRKNPNLLLQSVSKMTTLVDTYAEVKVKPYDVKVDPLGYLRLGAYFDEISGTITPVTTKYKDLDKVHELVMDNILPQFKRHIEELGANKILYKRVGTTLQKVDDTAPVHEEAAQVLFHGIADQVCHQSNIMVSRESKTAPGAVDFALGTGFDDKVLVEIKKSSNGSLLDGYTKQLDRYEKSEAAHSAVYVVIVVKQSDNARPESQLNELKKLYKRKRKAGKKIPELVIIDGLIHDSASKL